MRRLDENLLRSKMLDTLSAWGAENGYEELDKLIADVEQDIHDENDDCEDNIVKLSQWLLIAFKQQKESIRMKKEIINKLRNS